MSTENVQTDFAGWFHETFGAEFPVRLVLPLPHLRDQIWTSEPRPDSVPMTSNCQRPAGDHLLAGFWGHSVNSYAFYLIQQFGSHRLFFRLSYGGAYGDPDKDAARVLGFLRGYQSFWMRWAGRLKESDLHHEMGKSYASVVLEDGTTVKLDDPPGADPVTFWQRLEEQTGSAGQNEPSR